MLSTEVSVLPGPTAIQSQKIIQRLTLIINWFANSSGFLLTNSYILN